MQRWLILLLVQVCLFAADSRKERIPTRDSAYLSATVTLPDVAGPFPVILMFSQPARDLYTSAGYATVMLRASLDLESADGTDVIEWIAQQSWANGKVAILGDKTSGNAAYTLLLRGAQHLVAGVVQGAEPGKFNAANLSVPVLHFTEWFDAAAQSTIESFHLAQNKGNGTARGNQKLIIGPASYGARSPGELPWESGSPSPEILSLRWFDFWLRGVDTGVQKTPAVQYFALGDLRTKEPPANEWRSVSGWPPAHEDEYFYLLPGGGLSRTPTAQNTGSSSFDYNPADPVPSLSAAIDDPSRNPPFDQRPLHERGDILHFVSLPRPAPVEIAGPVHAELYVSTSSKDTDFFVRLVDIHPDGFEALILVNRFRLRYREGAERLMPARKNKVYKLDMSLGSIAMLFPAGHRIAIQITSSDVPRFERHSNTWDPVENDSLAVTATNTVYHSEQYPSRVILPVVKPRR